MMIADLALKKAGLPQYGLVARFPQLHTAVQRHIGKDNAHGFTRLIRPVQV